MVAKFSDFAISTSLSGDKTTMNNIIDKEITVLAYRIFESHYSTEGKAEQCLHIQFILDEKTYIVFTGSIVLKEQLEQYKEHIPFITTVKRIKNFYTFT